MASATERLAGAEPALANDVSSALGLRAKRREIFGSQEFNLEIARILGLEPERSRLAVEALLESEIIPRSGEVASVASSKDSAFLLAACSSPAADTKTIASMARRVVSMEFQCDYGGEASGDRKGARISTESTVKDNFGTQLCAVLRDICGRAEDEEPSCGVGREAGITIGWTGGMQSMGALHFDLPHSDVSFLYANTALFAEFHPGITLNRLNFVFESRLDVPPEALRRFGRLMREVGYGPQEESATTGQEFRDVTSSMRGSMEREGWGIFDDGNFRQAIQKIDSDPVARFRTDQEAVDHIRSMAAIRSPLHQKALRLHYTEVRIDGERRTPDRQPGRLDPRP